jgi:dephospho-CoA kinase
MSRPVILGLTGSIGMGKSATAAMFRARGVPVHDADAAVHALYAAEGAAARAIGTAFPGTLAPDGSVDRTRLRAEVIGKPERLAALEALVHPLARRAASSFLAAHAHAPVAVLDIPLLFETGGEGLCDAVLVVTAPAAIQRERVLARPGMDATTLEAILKKQMPDAEKRARADFVLDTSLGFAHAETEVDAILARLRGPHPAP